MTIRVVGSLESIGNHVASGAGAFAPSAGPNAGQATDPTAVTLAIKKPDGTHLVYAWPTPGAGQLLLTREVLGRFYADVLLDQAGEWAYHLAGTGAVTAAAQGYLVVDRDWAA
jgi:hypothetical protein